MPSAVRRPEAAASAAALNYFDNLLRFETDCWDVHHAITNNRKDFIILDVRSENDYRRGHVPGAIHLPHSRINHEAVSEYPSNTLFVVYCAGSHCNGADKAALRLAKLERPVKKMIGGVIGWRDEGFELDIDLATTKDSTETGK